MKLTELPQTGPATHEALYRAEDASVGLDAIIAIHSTHQGPSAGGLRMKPYADFAAAFEDARRLSKGMTYKNAAAGLPLGGGKAVILGDPQTQKTPALLQAFGQAIAALNGRYITAEDMGMTPADMAEIATQTPHVAGLSTGAFASGDPSPITAWGIFNSIRTTAYFRFGSRDLNGRTVAVQGLGNVGWNLCKRLRAAGAELVVTDTDGARVQQAVSSFGAKAVNSDAIYGAEADIFAPCAIGAILNSETIPRLKVAMVAGGANNQLATPDDALALQARGILYAPDFVVNGGGIINVATEILQIRDREGFVNEKLHALDATLTEILSKAQADEVSPDQVAMATVDRIMAAPQAAE